MADAPLPRPGLDDAEIGYELGISEQTVKDHVTAIYRRFCVESTMEVLLILGWLIIPDEIGEEAAASLPRRTRRRSSTSKGAR